MVSTYDRLRGLIEVAARGGMPHAIDTAEERAEAEKLLREVREEGVPQDLAFLLDNALKAIEGDKEGRPLQVNPLFGAEGGDISYWIPMNETNGQPGERFDLLTPLPDGAYASFLVYYMFPDASTHQVRVFISKDEWDAMAAPLAEPADDKHATASAEAHAIGESIALFETVVGPKAGTADDRGSWEGNKYILNRNRPPDDRQQDCINDALTAAQYVQMLSAHALIHNYNFNPADPLVLLPYVHVAIKLGRAGNDPLVIDTWLGPNGAFPFIGGEAAWITATKPKD
jgi:hypothetical protein